MTILVVGTPDSGKSELAERLIGEISNGGNKYYLATMIAYDEDGHNRIRKHRKQREGKGFITIEEPFLISKALEKIEDASNSSVLLECISNLVGNEMYENSLSDKDNLDDYILEQIKIIAKSVKNLVIVTNEFELNEEYDIETIQYINNINKVNDKLIKWADKVHYVNHK